MKRWCDSGKISFRRTAGGHRRISLNDLYEFLRERETPLLYPEKLGLTQDVGPQVVDRSQRDQRLFTALTQGDDQKARSLILNAYLAGEPLETIFDEWITPVFREIGCSWETGNLEVYQERMSCEICRNVIHDLGEFLPDPQAEAPLAIGGTMAGDHYSLINPMLSMLLRDFGWRTRSLGSDLPAETLIQAIEHFSPSLVWLSVSHIENPARLSASFNSVYKAARSVGSLLVAGGRALDTDLRGQLRYTVFCDTLTHLVEFLRGTGLQMVSRRNPSQGR